MKPKKQTEDDERPDAWQRFERAVDIALHTRPSNKAIKPRRKKAKKPLKSRP